MFVSTNALRAIIDFRSSANAPAEAANPVFAIHFARKVAESIHTYLPNALVSRFEKSPLPARCYAHVVSHIKLDDTGDSISAPPRFRGMETLTGSIPARRNHAISRLDSNIQPPGPLRNPPSERYGGAFQGGHVPGGAKP